MTPAEVMAALRHRQGYLKHSTRTKGVYHLIGTVLTDHDNEWYCHVLYEDTLTGRRYSRSPSNFTNFTFHPTRKGS